MGSLTELRVSATSHGLNYLPEYLATRRGGFERRGLRVEATVRDPWTGVLDDLADGTADVALGGLWAPAMYAGMGRDLVAVAQLNARFPMVVVTRDRVDDFDWQWMRGRTVLVPGAGGTAPYEFTAGLMREAGADPSATRFVRDLSTGMLSELFVHGLGDAIVGDLVTAKHLAAGGSGHLSCRLADVGGPMPNSVYYVRRDRLDDLHDRLIPFVAGIDEAMTALQSGVETRDLLAAEWPELSVDLLLDAVGELVASTTWAGTRIDPMACERWVTILREGGLVTPALSSMSYRRLVDNRAVDAAAALAATPPSAADLVP